MSNADFTTSLATFASEIELRDLPLDVVAKARQLVLDCLGNQIGAYGEESAHILHGVLGVSSTNGSSTVVGYGNHTTPLLAGCMNGMLAHLLDMDDAHRDALTKTGSAVTPAAMAVAEARGCDGKRIVEAIVAGYEIMIRLGLAMNPGHRSRGFHSTATLGAFGAAATAGRILGLNPDKMADAFGIAATQAAGLTAFINNEAMTKPFNVAKGVHNGILAALLAEKNFRGPPAIIERPEGFSQAYADEANLAEATLGIGTRFRLLESGFKPHAACRYAHGPIDAANALMAQHNFAADSIGSMDVHLSALANRQSNFHEPKSVASAQGSTPFVIAASLLSRSGALTVASIRHAFKDENTWALHRRVQLVTDSNMDYMGRGCRIELHLKDGRHLRASIALPRGEPENPMSDDEIAAKFMSQASRTLGERKACAIRDKVEHLETLHTAVDVMTLTVATKECA